MMYINWILLIAKLITTSDNIIIANYWSVASDIKFNLIHFM